MLIFIYAVLTFIFFKVMPVFLLDVSNSVVGALMMAVASAIAMFVMTFFANLAGLSWVHAVSKRKFGDPFPFKAIGVAMIGIVASGIATWAVGYGFAEDMMDRIFGGLSSGDRPFWFCVMVLLPPAVHSLIILTDIVKMGNQVRPK